MAECVLGKPYSSAVEPDMVIRWRGGLRGLGRQKKSFIIPVKNTPGAKTSTKLQQRESSTLPRISLPASQCGTGNPMNYRQSNEEKSMRAAKGIRTSSSSVTINKSYPRFAECTKRMSRAGTLRKDWHFVNSGHQDGVNEMTQEGLPAIWRDMVSPIGRAGVWTAAEETSTRGAKDVQFHAQH